jgi:hypothetical protein
MPRTTVTADLARWAAYGAYGVVVVLIVLFGALVVVTRPVRTGGMNAGLAAVTWISTFVPVAALAAAHVALARQLLDRPGRRSA